MTSKEIEKLLVERVRLEREEAMDRLLQSVNTVKNVLQTNLKLRQQIVDLEKKLHQANIELYHLQTENEELKEKMIIMKNVDSHINCHSATNTNFSSHINLINNKMRHGRMIVASELFKLKKNNSLLEERLKNLERENINIRVRQNSCENNFEPVRSVVNITKQSLSNRMRKYNKSCKRKEENDYRGNNSYNILKTLYEKPNIQQPMSLVNIHRMKEKITRKKGERSKCRNSVNVKKGNDRNISFILKSEDIKHDFLDERNDILSNTQKPRLLYQTNISRSSYQQMQKQKKLLSFVCSKKDSVLAPITDLKKDL